MTSQRPRPPRSLVESLAKEEALIFQVPWSAIFTKRRNRKIVQARNKVALRLMAMDKYSINGIAQELGRSHSILCRLKNKNREVSP